MERRGHSIRCTVIFHSESDGVVALGFLLEDSCVELLTTGSACLRLALAELAGSTAQEFCFFRVFTGVWHHFRPTSFQIRGR